MMELPPGEQRSTVPPVGQAPTLGELGVNQGGGCLQRLRGVLKLAKRLELHHLQDRGPAGAYGMVRAPLAAVRTLTRST